MTLRCQSPLNCLAPFSPLLPSHTLFSLLQSDFYVYLYLATMLVTNTSNQQGFPQFSSHTMCLQFSCCSAALHFEIPLSTSEATCSWFSFCLSHCFSFSFVVFYSLTTLLNIGFSYCFCQRHFLTLFPNNFITSVLFWEFRLSLWLRTGIATNEWPSSTHPNKILTSSTPTPCPLSQPSTNLWKSQAPRSQP